MAKNSLQINALQNLADMCERELTKTQTKEKQEKIVNLLEIIDSVIGTLGKRSNEEEEKKKD
jgi:hypothetical protein